MIERFDEIYCLYSKDVYKLIYSYLLNVPDTEDILQKTFIKLYKNRKVLSLSNEEIKKWLFTVSVNNSKDLLKSSWKKLTLRLDHDINSYNMDENATFDLLKAIPKDYRIPLYLYYYEGYKIKEIAKIMKKSESAIKMSLVRGREKLKIELEGTK